MTQHYQDNLGGWHVLDSADHEHLLTKNNPSKTFTAKTLVEYGAYVQSLLPNPAVVAAEGKVRALEEARSLRADILARLNGLHIDALYANDIPPVIAAIMVAKQALKDITIHASVVAATDYDTTKVAILTRYYEIAAELGVNAPTAVSAFVGLDQ